MIQTPTSGGAAVDNWSFGSPEETFRESTINFSELGLTGRELIWRAEFVSDDDACVPETIAVDLSYTAALNTNFSRSSPVVLSNVLYNVSFETPDASWVEKDLRGHLESQRIYDPTNPTGGFAIQTNWDAGAVLTASSPGA